MHWSLDFVAHSEKARPLISSCADDEKVITFPSSSVDIRVQLTELTRSLEMEVGLTLNREPIAGRPPLTLLYSAIATFSGPTTVSPYET